MTFKVIRGQGLRQEMTSVPYRDYFFTVWHHASAMYDVLCLCLSVSICLSVSADEWWMETVCAFQDDDWGNIQLKDV